MTYYHITQLTGTGYEVLLDSVDGTLVAWFQDGYLFGIRPTDGPLDCAGQEYVPTKVAA